MDKENFEKLKEVVKNNYKWPLLLGNVTSDYFSTAVVLSAEENINNLEVGYTSDGDKLPTWLTELNIISQKYDRPMLVIDRIDKLELAEQEKFKYILKGSSSCVLPKNTQILLTVDNLNKVSNKLRQLCIIYEAEG